MLTQGPCIHPAACLRDYLSSVLPFSLLANLFLSPSAPCLLSASIVNHLIFTSLNPFLNCFIHFLVKGVTGVYIAGHRIYCIANLRLYQVWLRGLLVADVSSCLDLVRSHLAFVSCVSNSFWPLRQTWQLLCLFRKENSGVLFTVRETNCGWLEHSGKIVVISFMQFYFLTRYCYLKETLFFFLLRARPHKYS